MGELARDRMGPLPRLRYPNFQSAAVGLCRFMSVGPQPAGQDVGQGGQGFEEGGHGGRLGGVRLVVQSLASGQTA